MGCCQSSSAAAAGQAVTRGDSFSSLNGGADEAAGLLEAQSGLSSQVQISIRSVSLLITAQSQSAMSTIGATILLTSIGSQNQVLPSLLPTGCSESR